MKSRPVRAPVEIRDNWTMGVVDHPDRWVVEWSGSFLKRVTLRNPTTGQVASGRSWSEWDDALRDAVFEVERQGDLVSELEEFLEGR